MSSIVVWLATVEIIGLTAFPLAFFLLPKLQDRGYGLSKALGILIIGYAAWILSVTHIVPSVPASLGVLVVVMAAASVLIIYKRGEDMLDFLKRKWRLIAVSELIFLAFFIGWTLFRAYDPAIDHTEQPMDFAFLNASIRSTFGQPEDPWLRGETVSYYYFGHWLMGALSEISGVASNLSYNLSLALIPALAAVGMFSVVVTLVRSDGAGMRLGMVVGVASGFVLGIVSNLAGVLEFMRANAIGSQGFYDWIAVEGLDGPAESPTQSWYPEEFWWWFRVTRIINTFVDGRGIDYTIQEFPFFSFMLGDLHPHVSAIPFAILFTGLVLSFFMSDMLDFRRMRLRYFITVIAMGISLGGLAFTNMWDLPTYAMLLVGVAAIKAYPSQDSTAFGYVKRAALAIAQVPLVVVLLAVVLYLPYYLSFTSSVQGVGAVVTPTRYVHMLVVWGVPMALVAPFIIGSFWQTVVGPDWRRMTAISASLAVIPFVVWLLVRLQAVGHASSPTDRLIHIIPFALLIGMSAWSAIYETKTRGPSGRAFVLALATLALLLIMGPELLYVDDFFGDANERMNTIFKLYYQAWVLLAAVSGFSLYYWLRSRRTAVGWRKSLLTLWAAVAVVLVIGGLYYPPAALVTKTASFSSDPTLDGLAFVDRRSPAEYKAIEFVGKRLPRDAAILEAVGEWFDSGLVSRSTGVPTVFNWPGHQVQWRGNSEVFAGRQQDVDDIYQTLDPLEAQNLLAKYDVNYVYIGPRERSQYDGPGLDKFPDFMDVVFQQDDVAIYRVRR